MFDGPENEDLKRVLAKFNTKIICAVCHGPAGLLGATNEAGESILKGKRATGFSNAEEKAVAKDKLVPYSLEDRMKALGAEYECGADWSEFVVIDGNLITGQNPQSSRALAEAVTKALLPGIDPVHGKGEGEGLHKRGHPFTHEDHRDHAEGKIPHHPQANMHQWQSPIRQTTHTGVNAGHRAGGHPDKSYIG